jgi:hydroxylaminobenzene mutase
VDIVGLQNCLYRFFGLSFNSLYQKEHIMTGSVQTHQGGQLVRYGVILFLLGLLTGFLLPAMANPRMGLSSHLEGVLNGMFLMILGGVIWPKLQLSGRTLSIGFWLVLFGTFVNWGTTLLAGFWGAGSEMMPLPAGGYIGAAWQELLIKIGLIALSVAMVVVCGIVLWGLRSKGGGETH